MNRIIVSLTALALAGSASLRAAETDPNLDYNVLQGRIASLESKVKMLETALNELSAEVAAEPSPTKQTAPAPKPQAPAPAPTASADATEQPNLPSPAPEKTKAPAADPELEKYTIGEGDTISSIAQTLGIPRSELMEANSLREGQQIYIGDQLIVPQPQLKESPEQQLASNDTPTRKPAPSSKKEETTKPAGPTSPEAGSYTVKSGDTLSRIAKQHGISIAALKTANNLSSDLITLGQTLKIPGKSKGNTTPQADENTVAASEDVNKLLRPEENYGVYTVERGDTLYSLARDFFTTPAEIQRLNRLGESTSIRPGQDLIVPTSAYEKHHDLAKNG